MSGLIGSCGMTDLDAAEQLMTRMAEALGAGDRFQVDRYVGTSVSLARLHLNIIDQAPQPLWSEDGKVALILTGEIFSWHGLHLPQPLTGQEPHFSNTGLLLAAYLEHGDAFVGHINGNYAAAIWDSTRGTLILVTDHLGTHPLYYTHVQDHLVFASGVRAVAQAAGVRCAVDLAAMAEMIVFEQVYGDKTLFADVRVVPPGTLLHFHAGTYTTARYIDFQYPELYELHDEAYYIEGWIEYTRQAVARQTRAPAPLGVLLTGGLDSRSILGLLAGSTEQVKTFTFGIPGCDDERAAGAMAHLLHLPHKFFPIAPDYLAHLGEKGVRITDGMKSCTHLNMIATLDQIVQEARVLYKGFLGGTIHGYVVTRDRLAPLPEPVWFEQILTARSHAFQEQQLPHLYTDALLRQVQDVPRQSLRAALAQSRSSWWVDKDSYIDLYQEDRRFTLLGVQLARSQALVRTPLADQDLVRFALSVPPGLRLDKYYYRKALAKALPKLAKIPDTETGYPILRDTFRELGYRSREQLRWWLRNHGLTWIPARPHRPYLDYPGWFRGELRPWVEATLLSPRCLERGYFQPAYVRNLVAEHMAGHDHTRRLGVLVTLELWHRQFMN